MKLKDKILPKPFIDRMKRRAEETDDEDLKRLLKGYGNAKKYIGAIKFYNVANGDKILAMGKKIQELKFLNGILRSRLDGRSRNKISAYDAIKRQTSTEADDVRAVS